jgi:hypothetical protein
MCQRRREDRASVASSGAVAAAARCTANGTRFADGVAMMTRISVAFVLVSLCAACSSTSASPAGDNSEAGAAAPCTQDSDCSGYNPTCAFRVADGCSAHGVCVTTTGAGTCDAATRPVCACDGKTTALSGYCNLPAGFEHQPLSHAGACEADAGHD